MNIRRKALCLAAALTMLAAAVVPVPATLAEEAAGADAPAESAGATASTEDSYQLVEENARLRLTANRSNGQIAVEDLVSGQIWYSNPEGANEDPLAAGTYKASLLSQITITYTTEKGQVMTETSYLNSVMKGGLTSKIEGGKAVFVYDFPTAEIRIPVKYNLTEGAMQASLLTREIEEYGTNELNTIDLLPYFGAGGSEDEGYMLVPDGSGALIDFNNGKTSASEFSSILYGYDYGTSDRSMETQQAEKSSRSQSQNLYLPVFGLKCNREGYLAVITESAGRATIKAQSGGNYTSYNTVYSSYQYRAQGSIRLLQKEFDSKITTISERNPDGNDTYQVSYMFLDTGENEYTDMAALYREYLLENGGLEKRVESGDIPFYLDLYGYIRKTKAFFGIPMDTKIATTTFEDAVSIVGQLNAGGVKNTVVKYNYWMKDGYYGRIQTNAKIEGKVGSQKELDALNELLRASGGSLFLSVDLTNVYKTGSGFSTLGDALNNVSNTTQPQYTFALDSASVDSRYKAGYLTRPTSLSGFFDTFLKNYAKRGVSGLAVDALGNMVYSDLSSKGMSRSEIPGLYGDILDKALETADELLVTGAGDYAAARAAHILNTPLYSSGYDLEDDTVPFYQIVFHGYASYSVGATNLASNPETMALRCLETGAAPMYSWVGRNSAELIGSRSDFLYSADYERWIDSAVEEYHTVNAVLSKVADQPITGHEELADNVYQTTYGGTTRVIVNYNAEPVVIDGQTIEAEGFVVK
ncbi:MAG TPA: hypothetical protein H9684_01225 [Firmicutes bacterium]|nr:hypothetical protein [Bacillota bacterium]